MLYDRDLCLEGTCKGTFLPVRHQFWSTFGCPGRRGENFKRVLPSTGVIPWWCSQKKAIHIGGFKTCNAFTPCMGFVFFCHLPNSPIPVPTMSNSQNLPLPLLELYVCACFTCSQPMGAAWELNHWQDQCKSLITPFGRHGRLVRAIMASCRSVEVAGPKPCHWSENHLLWNHVLHREACNLSVISRQDLHQYLSQASHTGYGGSHRLWSKPNFHFTWQRCSNTSHGHMPMFHHYAWPSRCSIFLFWTPEVAINQLMTSAAGWWGKNPTRQSVCL